MYIEREITGYIKKSAKGFPSVALVGARQTGKSTLLQKIFGKDYKYVSFDDLLLRERALTDPALFMTELKSLTILDEIQYVPDLLSYLKMEIDRKRIPGKYLLTGSQQFSMMKGLSESLAGRVALLKLYPFSFTELLSAGILDNAGSDNFFEFACLKGLYPELSVNLSLNNQTWYSSYVQTYIEKDVKSIYNIGDLRTFGQFLRLLASRCSQPLNYSSLSKELGISVGTVKNWVSVLVAGNIIYLLQPFYQNFGKRIVKSPKVYWLDNGLVSYLTGMTTIEQIKYGLLGGPLFENLVITETLKFLNNNGLYNSMYYIRTSNQQEIDLLIQNGNVMLPFEIKLTKSPKTSMLKGITSLKKLFPRLNLQKSNLICLVDNGFPLDSGSDVVNLQEYLEFLRTTLL